MLFALIDKKWPSATIEFWNDRGVSWDIHVVYLKITSKETVRLLCISFENQTKETKIEKELFITNGIASVKKISTEDMGKIAGLFREITEVSGYIPAFVCFPGEDEKDTDDLPEGTWSYVIGEKINVDRSKGLSQAAVYISKDFKVIDHKIVGSIE